MLGVIREREVIRLTGLSRSTIWRQERKGDFPSRRRLSQRAVGWLESEILAWMEGRKRIGVGENIEAKDEHEVVLER